MILEGIEEEGGKKDQGTGKGQGEDEVGGKFKGKALRRRRREGDEVHGGVHKNSVPGKYPVTVPNCPRRSDLVR